MKADFEKGTKICSRCKKELPIDMFGKDKTGSDNLNCYCKQCAKEYYKQYYEKNKKKMIEHNVSKQSIFGRKGRERGNSGVLKRDYELNEEQIKRREYNRKRKNSKKAKSQGIMIWYSGKLNNLDSKDYAKQMNREYYRQKYCAIRGYVGRTQMSEHFIFDFDLEQMLNDNVYYKVGKNRIYMVRWWEGNIRHWTVKDGIWKE